MILAEPPPAALFVSTQSPFLGGVVVTLALVSALLFLRFYRRTRDPLFLFFSISLALLGIGRLATLVFAPDDSHPERLAPFYIIRLVAYGLIILAIIIKNRARRRHPTETK